MKKFWIAILTVMILGIMSFSFVSCKDAKGGPAISQKDIVMQLPLLPDSTFMIVVFDVPKIQEKMDLANIQSTGEQSHLTKLAMNLDLAGVDAKKNACFFGVAPQNKTLFGLAFSLMDPEMYENTLKTISEADSIYDTGTYRYTFTDGGDLCVGWTNENVLAILTPEDFDEYNMLESADENDILNLMDKVFNQQGKPEFTKDQNLGSMLARSEDIRMWMNMRYLPIPNIPWDYSDIYDLRTLKNEDNYVNAVMNFENGKITADSWYELGDSLSAFSQKYTKLYKSGIDSDLIDVVQVEGEALMLVSSALDFPTFMRTMVDDIQKIEDYAGVIALGMIYMAKFNLTYDNIYDAFAGDMITVINQPVDGDPYMSLFARIGDQKSFDKVQATVGELLGGFLEREGYKGIETDEEKQYFHVENGILMITSSEEMMKKLVAGKNENPLPAEERGKIGKLPVYMTFDLSKFMDYINKGEMDDDNHLWVETMKKYLGTMTYKYENEHGYLEITMNDTTKNSLHQIIQLVVTASEE